MEKANCLAFSDFFFLQWTEYKMVTTSVRFLDPPSTLPDQVAPGVEYEKKHLQHIQTQQKRGKGVVPASDFLLLHEPHLERCTLTHHSNKRQRYTVL